MSKSLVPSIGQNISTYSFNGDMISHSVITSDFAAQNAVDEISNNIARESSPPYVLGKVLRHIWNNLPTFNFPAVGAAQQESFASSHQDLVDNIEKDKELEDSLSKARIEIYQESSSNLERDQELIKNFSSELRLAAEQGDRSRSLILSALRDLDLKILIFDPTRSQEAISEYTKDKGGFAPEASYDTDDKTIRVFAFWDGKFSSAVLIHELGHAYEFQKGVDYDKTSIDECFGNLKAFESQLFDGISKYSKSANSKIQNDRFVEHYKGVYFQDSYSNFVSMFGNYYDKESGVLSLNFGGNKGVNILSQVLIDDDRVIHNPYAVVSNTSGRMRDISENEKKAYHAYFSSYKLSFSHRILSERYENSEGEERETNLKEMHAYLRTLVPEKVLDIFCPTGFLKKPLPEVEIKSQEAESLLKKESRGREDL